MYMGRKSRLPGIDEDNANRLRSTCQREAVRLCRFVVLISDPSGTKAILSVG